MPNRWAARLSTTQETDVIDALVTKSKLRLITGGAG